MSAPEPTETAGELQFDQAEFTPGAAPASPTCAACRRPILDQYYTVNNQILCTDCTARVHAPANFSTKFKRFALASIFGTVAAVAGFVIYFGVSKLMQGRQFGLISILVGFIVGGAVRKGSGGRGGWLYQALAIFLTYSAIAASLGALALVQEKAQVQEKPGAAKADKANAPEKNEAKPDVELTSANVAIALVFIVLAVVFVYALPIIAGFESPILLFIVGFALWEAWKLNRRLPRAITGPYRVVAATGKGSMEDPYDV